MRADFVHLTLALRIASCCIAWLLAGIADADGTDRSYAASTALVTIDALVTDPNGHPVTGLNASDFVVFEDGNPREISQFQAVDVTGEVPKEQKDHVVATNVVSANSGEVQTTRAFAIVLDDLHLSASNVAAAVRITSEFIKTSVRRDDAIVFSTTSGSQWWIKTPRDGADDLLAIVAHVTARRPVDTSPGHITDWEAQRIHDRDRRILALVTRRLTDLGALSDLAPSTSGYGIMKETGVLDEGHPMVRSMAETSYLAAASRRHRMLETLRRVADALTVARGRKALILVSEGFVDDSQRSEYRAFLEAARSANVATYFLNVRGVGELATASSTDTPRLLLESKETVGERSVYLDAERNEAEGAVSLAVDTGGYAVGPTADLVKALRRIGEQQSAYYLLGFTPTRPSDGKYHKLRVEVRRKGATILARSGYFAGTAKERQASRKPAAESATMEVAQDAPVEGQDISLRLAGYVREGTPTKTTVLVVGEAEMPRLSDKHPVKLDYVLHLTGRDSGREAEATGTIAVSNVPGRVGVKFEIPGDVWQLRWVVCDRTKERCSSVTHRVVVPSTGAPRMTTPIVTDVVESGLRPVPVAHCAFDAGASLVAEIELVGTSGVNVSSGFRFEGPHAQTIAQLEPTKMRPTANGQFTRMFRLPTVSEPGLYTFTAIARDDAGGILSSPVTLRIGVEPKSKTSTEDEDAASHACR